MSKIIYSGIQPSGVMTLGNYIGAVKNWRLMQDDPDHRCIYMLADLHTITVRQNPQDLHDNAMRFMALCLAMGIDKDRSILYMQSHVHEHCELAWLLNCYTYVGEMNRMTQFKDKSAKHADNINMGLMDYPVLMAADILLFGTHCVPVGIDQVQHVEIARDIATRVNNLYGDVFVVPEGVMTKVGAKIMSLQDPTSKMSKSDPTPNAVVSVLDTPETIVKKFKKAVTDSDTQIAYDPISKPGVSNLLTILAAATDRSVEATAADCRHMRYGDLKLATADAVIEMLRPFRERYDRLIADPAYLHEVAAFGAGRAREIAAPILRRFKQAIGFVLPSAD